jgi:sulfite exporter TauE/SafE
MNLLPVFVVGLAGSVHCAGMCGGIVSAFSVVRGPAIPIAPAAGMSAAARAWPQVLAYNAGRIASYSLAGAIAGGLASSAASLTHVAQWQTAGYWLMNLMLAALGLYLMDAWRGLARIEAAGGTLWQSVQRSLRPVLRAVVPMDTPLKALGLGAIWGWVPCGMVYSVLLTALLSGSALQGAAVMAAFGLGTLPMLLAMGLLGAQLRTAMQRRHVRLLCGLLVLGFGILGIARAAGGMQHGWIDALCLTVQP